MSTRKPFALRSLASALGCLFAAATPSIAQPTLQSGDAVPTFADGQAQEVDAFKDPSDWIQHQLWVETEFDSDGDGKLDRMHVDVTRPKQTEDGLKVAVIYETSPYYCGTGTLDKRYFWDPEQELGDEAPERKVLPPVKTVEKDLLSNSHIKTWVPRGFAVVHSASPGTGQSDGCPTVGGQNESLGPKAVIDWLCGRAKGYTERDGDEEVEAYWSTGKVGMTGTSYNGTLPLAAATTGVEGLEAIIPVAANTSYYNYYRSNGLVRHPGGYMGEDIDVLYDFINSGDAKTRDYCNSNVRDTDMAEGLDRATGDYNDFWDGREYDNVLKNVRAATLMAHGLNDWNVMPDHSIHVYATLKANGVPAQLFLHQGGHGGPPPHEMMNRWFTRYLYGVENGVEEDERAWIVRESDKRTQPTPYADYPNPDSAPVTLHLQAGGAKTGVLSTAAAEGQGTETLVDDVAEAGADLAKADKSKHRLIYATPELTEAVHVSGAPRLKIRLAADEPAVNLSVWLVSLPWTKTRDINSNIISRGWADPQNRNSMAESEPLVPGEFYDVSFTLQSDDQIVPAGQRIGLMIFSSDRDFTLWPEAGTKLTVDLDGTQLDLPVVGGEEAFLRATGAKRP